MSLWTESLNTFAAIWLETLIRACWQGGLALALVWAVFRLLPRLPAWSRCWLWRLAYLKLLLAFLWLPTLDLPLLPPVAPPITAPAAADFAPAAAPVSEAITAASLSAEAPNADAPSVTQPTVAGWLLLLWTGGLLWQSGQAIRQGLLVRRLRKSGKPLDGGPLDIWNVALCRDLNLALVPRLLSSTATTTPVLIGILKPCIVLPESLLASCSPEELRLMLAHELAHVRRRDLLWGWLPLLTRLLCGFHPLARLAEGELSMAQEIACDETALSLTGAASLTYGSLLVRVATRFASRPTAGFGMIGMTESYHTLKRRLSAMKSFPSAPRPYRVAVRFGLFTLGLAALLPWRVAAQATPPVATPPPTPTIPATPAVPPAPTPPDPNTVPPAPVVPSQAPPTATPRLPSPAQAPPVVVHPVAPPTTTLPTPTTPPPTQYPGAPGALPPAQYPTGPGAPLALPPTQSPEGPVAPVALPPSPYPGGPGVPVAPPSTQYPGGPGTPGALPSAQYPVTPGTPGGLPAAQYPGGFSPTPAQPATPASASRGSARGVRRPATAAASVVAPQGYPVAAPGMISPSRPAPTDATRSAPATPRRAQSAGGAPRASGDPRRSAAPIRRPLGFVPAPAMDPSVQPTPGSATPNPFGVLPQPRGRGRSADAPTATPAVAVPNPTSADPSSDPRTTTPAPGVAPQNPFAVPVDPAVKPATVPKGGPVDPAVKPVTAPRGGPVDPVPPVATPPAGAPPVSVPAPPAPKASV